MEAFLHAIKNKNYDVVETILAEDSSFVNAGEGRAMVIAVQQIEDLRMVKLLHRYGANLYYRPPEAPATAGFIPHLRPQRALVDDPRDYAINKNLMYAVKHNLFDIVRYFVEEGEHIEMGVIVEALNNPNADMVKFILNHTDEEFTVKNAAGLRTFAEYTAVFNEESSTLDRELIDMLLERGLLLNTILQYKHSAVLRAGNLDDMTYVFTNSNPIYNFLEDPSGHPGRGIINIIRIILTNRDFERIMHIINLRRDGYIIIGDYVFLIAYYHFMGLKDREVLTFLNNNVIPTVATVDHHAFSDALRNYEPTDEGRVLVMETLEAFSQLPRYRRLLYQISVHMTKAMADNSDLVFFKWFSNLLKVNLTDAEFETAMVQITKYIIKSDILSFFKYIVYQDYINISSAVRGKKLGARISEYINSEYLTKIQRQAKHMVNKPGMALAGNALDDAYGVLGDETAAEMKFCSRKTMSQMRNVINHSMKMLDSLDPEASMDLVNTMVFDGINSYMDSEPDTHLYKFDLDKLDIDPEELEDIESLTVETRKTLSLIILRRMSKRELCGLYIDILRRTNEAIAE